MSKKTTDKKAEKQASKKQPSELSETDLDAVQGAGEFFDATITEFTLPALDAKGNTTDAPGSSTLSPPTRKR